MPGAVKALIFALLVACATPSTSHPMEPTPMTTLTNQSAVALYAKYVSAWRAIPDDQRAAITAAIITEHPRYSTPRHASGDRATIVDDMRVFQAKFPGGHFDIGDVSVHHDVALLTWILVQADGTEVARGHDQVRVGTDGKIAELITFAPSVAPPAP